MQMPGLLSLAAQSARHAADRHAVTARNMVNADTPGFLPRDVTPFTPGGDEMPLRRTRPEHMAGMDGQPWRTFTVAGPVDPNGNGVDLESEILRGVEANGAHNRAMTVYKGALDLMRASVGRG